FGNESYQYLLEHGFLPPELELTYRSVVEDVLLRVNNLWQAAGSVRNIRLHGDCHPGNILWTDDGPHFVDLDDTRMGPAIQDLWMLLSGDRHEMEQQLAKVLRGYVEFMDFNPAELNLIEALRTLRMIHYAAWLARRWGDPAFLQAFPWFNTQRYWEEHILQLREQMATMEEPVLNWI
ncbi:MAG: serine/threonine protein kinase, partial [Gammaproteobacteria bacterium]|nr:serine/threonine protein kinase [Gammaproteobacteria bacterium]